MENLSEMDCHVHTVVFLALRQRGALPPFLGPVDGVFDRVGFRGIVDVTDIAELSLVQVFVVFVFVWPACQLAENLRLVRSACRCGIDLLTSGYVEVRRSQHIRFVWYFELRTCQMEGGDCQ